VETIGNQVRVSLGSLSKRRENREINYGLLKGFLLLQSIFTGISNMAVEETVADRADALGQEEQKQGRERKYHQKKMKSISTKYRKPKGINLREGECRGGMSPPPIANS